ncbi:DoxX family membrane protein [Spirosoma rhododendri]|uniref:DoxX family membrane protein n=1 Tax=Spirosoma rhododendri TaxID=2728024 RepID=A0A7L5DIX8_9BACT|nr:DoxX family membrane protein [Spirosoma rhododendri]QJD77371.1 DoxX family membrane protein [Spirosoma rhododendri]
MASFDEPSASQLSRLVLRLGLGVNMLMHGLVRIPKLGEFVAKTSAGFSQTVLPSALTTSFLYALPFAELACGLLILLGGQLSKWGYALGGLIIAILLFGTTLKEDWTGAGNQTIYVIAFAYALRTLDSNRRQ